MENECKKHLCMGPLNFIINCRMNLTGGARAPWPPSESAPAHILFLHFDAWVEEESRYLVRGRLTAHA